MSTIWSAVARQSSGCPHRLAPLHMRVSQKDLLRWQRTAPIARPPSCATNYPRGGSSSERLISAPKSCRILASKWRQMMPLSTPISFKLCKTVRMAGSDMGMYHWPTLRSSCGGRSRRGKVGDLGRQAPGSAGAPCLLVFHGAPRPRHPRDLRLLAGGLVSPGHRLSFEGHP